MLGKTVDVPVGGRTWRRSADLTGRGRGARRSVHVIVLSWSPSRLGCSAETLARRRKAVRILVRCGRRMHSKRVADVEVVLRRSSNVTRTLTPTRVRSATGKELIAVVRIVKHPPIIWKDDLSLPRERQEIQVLGAPIGSQVTWFEPDQTLQFAERRGIDHNPDPCCHVVRTSERALVGPGLEVPSWRESPPAREIQAGPDGLAARQQVTGRAALRLMVARVVVT